MIFKFKCDRVRKHLHVDDKDFSGALAQAKYHFNAIISRREFRRKGRTLKSSILEQNHEKVTIKAIIGAENRYKQWKSKTIQYTIELI